MQALIVDNPKGAILIPVSLVAQIISREQMQPTVRQVPFLLGELPWREFHVPVISGCSVLGGDTADDKAFQRAVILWPMKGGKTTDFFAITSHDAPRVVNIENQPFSDADVAAAFDARYCMGCVDLPDGLAAIPDLNRIADEVFGRSSS